MVFATNSAQSPQYVSERWFLLPSIPGSVWELEEGVTTLMEPYHGKAVQEEGHRCRSLDGEWLTIGRSFQPKELFTRFKGAFDGPPIMPSQKHL